MTKREKRLQKLRQNPYNVSFADLEQALNDVGFELDHATGSHHVFRAKIDNQLWTVVIPFTRPVKPAYVRKAVDAIDEVEAAKAKESAESEEESDDK